MGTIISSLSLSANETSSILFRRVGVLDDGWDGAQRKSTSTIIVFREISQKVKELTIHYAKCRSEQGNCSAVTHHLTLTDAEDFHGAVRPSRTRSLGGYWVLAGPASRRSHVM